MIDTLGYNRTRPIYLPQPVNSRHSLNRGRLAWWMTVPGLYGGNKLHDLCGLNSGTLTNMGSASGWRPTPRPGGFGHLLFDGTDDLVSCPHISLNQMSVGCWFYNTSSAASFKTFVCDYTNANATSTGLAWILRIPSINSNTQVEFYTNSGTFTNLVAPVSTIALNTWYRILCTYDGAARRIYINGKQVATDSYSGTIITTTNPIRIGASATAGEYMQGNLDDVSLWSRALSATEAFNDYNLSRFGYPGVLNRIAGIPAGDPSTQYTQSLTATSTVSASIIKQINKRVSATSTGTATATKSTGKSLSATSTGTASLVRSVGKVLSATVTGTASIVKAISKTLSATVVGTAIAAASRLITRVVRIIKGGRGDRVVKGGGSDDVTKGGGVG
jgi:hypothetical protein